jgi:hypothetical protein
VIERILAIATLQRQSRISDGGRPRRGS